LKSKEGSQLSFQEIMESLQIELVKQKIHEQHPDVSGNVDTVAFCFGNVMKVSPHPYNLVEVNDANKIKFESAYMLPLVTVKSKYNLYEITDLNMTKKTATIIIDEILPNDIIVTFSELSTSLGKKKRFRAVEVYHEIGDIKNYVKVFVDHDDNELLKLLKRKLKNPKGDMYSNRRSYPVKKLPPTAFISVSEHRKDYDVKVKLVDHVLTVKDKDDNLVCPMVKLDFDLNIYLVASYIASYAHWNMLHKLSSNENAPITAEKGLIIDENSLKLVMYGEREHNKFNREIQPKAVSNEGYEFHLNWVKSSTEAFNLCFNADVKTRCHLRLIYLDLNYNTVEIEGARHTLNPGELNNIILIQNQILEIEKIVEKGGKWCNPFFELRIFLCSLKPERDMLGVESEGILEADFKNSKGEEVGNPPDRALKARDGSEKPWWVCIPIKIYVKELEKYARLDSDQDLCKGIREVCKIGF